MSTQAWPGVLIAICVVLLIVLLTTPMYGMVSPYQIPIGILFGLGAVVGAVFASASS